MVLEEFICHAERHLQVRPAGSIDLPADSRLEPFAASNAETAATTATGRIGRMCDSITRRGEGIGRSNAGVLLRSGEIMNSVHDARTERVKYVAY